MKRIGGLTLTVVAFCLGTFAWGDSAAVPTATPIGPPPRKQGYFLSIQDRVAEQYRRIRIGLKAGQLTRDQGLALRVQLKNFLKQAEGDRTMGKNEPPVDVQKSRWEQLTAIARAIDQAMASSHP